MVTLVIMMTHFNITILHIIELYKTNNNITHNFQYKQLKTKTYRWMDEQTKD